MHSGIRRPLLHGKALRTAQAACAKYGGKLPDDLREVLGYWQSCELALERAATQLIEYAAALGIAEGSEP